MPSVRSPDSHFHVGEAVLIHVASLALILLETVLNVFVSGGSERSEQERGCSYFRCFPSAGASVSKQSEAALNYML